jgi:hypothetical protein
MKADVSEEHMVSIVSKNKAETIALLAASLFMVYSQLYSSIVKMKAKYFSETSVAFYRTTWNYIPKDRTFQSSQ